MYFTCFNTLLVNSTYFRTTGKHLGDKKDFLYSNTIKNLNLNFQLANNLDMKKAASNEHSDYKYKTNFGFNLKNQPTNYHFKKSILATKERDSKSLNKELYNSSPTHSLMPESYLDRASRIENLISIF